MRAGRGRNENPMQTEKKSLLSLSKPLCFAAATLVWIPFALGTSAQEPAAEGGHAVIAAAVVPQQVRHAGKLAVRAGETVEAEFRIYAAPEGGEPLWTEAQQVQVQLDGSYSVLLGVASPAGLPQTVFAGGAARWLGVSVDRSPEQERVLLSSVPYAMKSADAESLAGHAASDFVTQEQLAALAAASVPAAQASQSAAASPEARPDGVGPITGVGTTNTIALFTGANAIGNSEIVQSGSDIGINEATPTATLDVGGTANVRGMLSLPATGLATTGGGKSSEPLELTGSAWSTAVPGPVAQNFALETTATGNDTATPGGTLQLLYGSGTNPLAATGFYISNNGKVTFTSGQTFPNTLANVVANSPLTAVTSAGISTIGLSTGILETTLNAVYPQLTAANTFHGSQTIDGGLTLTSALTGTTETLTGALNSYGAQSTGTVLLKTPNTATAASGYNSPVFMFTGSAYNSGTAAAVNQNFSWQAVVQGNNTATPSANLALLAGSGNANQSPTGLSISPKGVINWVASQTFPITGTGGGTITGITTSSPLTGSGTSGSVALGLNQSTLVTNITPSLETTFNGIYAQLGASNNFTGDNTFNDTTLFSNYIEVSANEGPGTAAVNGYGTNGSDGVYGSSDTGYGAWGYSTSGQGVYGQVTSPVDGSEGVLGSTGTSFSAVYASEISGVNAGIWGDNSAAGSGVPIAVFGTSDSGYGGAFVNNSNSFPALYASNGAGAGASIYGATGDGLDATSATAGNGVYAISNGGGDGVEGVSSSLSNEEAGVLGVGNTSSLLFGVGYDVYAGVWGDTGTSSDTVSPAWAVGVVGTADDSHAGVFLNNSSGWTTLFLENYSSGGTGLFKTFMAKSTDGTCGIGSGGSLSCTGQIKALVSAGNGARTVETYAVQSPENWMEDFGTGAMEKGVAVVKIDATFAETASETAEYHVFLTPKADSKGLYVINETPTSFEVRESGGGTSSLSFDYRIVAKRRGYEAQRHVDVTERFNTEMRAASMARSTGIRHKPAVLAKSPLQAALNSHARPMAAPRPPTPHRPMVRPTSATVTAPRP